MDDTLALSRVDGRDSDLDDGLLVSSIAVDGSVCLLDHCFQVGLDGLVVQSLFFALYEVFSKKGLQVTEKYANITCTVMGNQGGGTNA